MMVLRLLRNQISVLLAALVLLSAPAVGWAQTISITRTDDPAIQQLRQASLGFLGKGQWASADAAVKQLLTRNPEDPVGLELSRLIAEQHRIARIRDEQRSDAFAESTQKIIDLIDKQAWDEALSEATHAADLATNKKELHKQSWFDRLVEQSTAEAQKHRDAGNWMKATTVYSQMASLFERENNQYRDLAKQTTRFAKLEAVYKDAAEAEKVLVGIDEGMMAAALEQVRRYYVKEPDFKKMAVAGIENLLAMTEAPSLAEALPALADNDARQAMRKQLEQLRDRVNDMGKVALPELAQAYIKAKAINSETVKLPEAMIIREFLDGALEPLDSFSTMIWPADKSEFEKSMRGKFFGVGIQISLESNELTVVSPLEDTPAYRAGIQAGDVIVAIDGEPTQGITLDGAVRRITGQQGTPVVLSVRRGRAGIREVRLVREEIVIKTVKGYQRDRAGQWDYLVDKDYRIGYVRVTNFMPQTVDDLEAAMDAMAAKGVRGLIMDFRFNPGGLLNQAVAMSDLFLDGGVIVSTDGRATRKHEELAKAGATNRNLPLVVLVNDFSASAAEIVTGALKDHRRAVIVGDRTFGKGSVQNVIPVGRDNNIVGGGKEPPAYLKLTTAYYYLPSGRSLHRHEDSEAWGVEPDIGVKVTRDEVQDILDLRRTSDVLYGPDGGEPAPPATQPDAAAAPATQPDRIKLDAQLDTALIVLRAELLKRKM